MTTRARTMVDLAAVLKEAELARVLRVAMRFGQMTTAALRDELALRTRGHSGVVTLRRLFRLVRE